MACAAEHLGVAQTGCVEVGDVIPAVLAVDASVAHGFQGVLLSGRAHASCERGEAPVVCGG